MFRSALWLFLLPPLAAGVHTISGCVKDEKGAPAGKAVVHIKELEGAVRLTATADSKGCYRQEIVPDGAYEIQAEPMGGSIASRQIVLDARKRNVTVDLQYHLAARPEPAALAAPIVNLHMLAATGASLGKLGNPQNSRLKSVTFEKSEIDSGAHETGHVTLAKPATLGGIVVQLSASNVAMVTLPPETTIPEGQIGGAFPIRTARLRGPSDIRIEITATDGESSVSAELRLRSYTRITVQVKGEGSGVVTSVPEGIQCSSGSCSAPFADEASVKLSAQPAPGSVFRGWSDGCGREGLIEVTGPMVCTITFARQ